MSDVPANHPRALSLELREKIEYYRQLGIVANAGPIAHGRGEAFDYLLGETTPTPVLEDIYTAAALLLEAKYPVISVNGNTAVLAPKSLVSLSRKIPAKLEVNVFYGRTGEREKKIADYLISQGAPEVIGINAEAKVPNLHSARMRVDKNGMALADIVLVSLEDGDRTKALIDWGKKVISIDLNPLSRTAVDATLNICDNVIRALPLLEKAVQDLRTNQQRIKELTAKVNNDYSTARVLRFLNYRLRNLATIKNEFSILEATEKHINFINSLTKSVIEEGYFYPQSDEFNTADYMRSKLNSESTYVNVLLARNNPCGFIDGDVRDDHKFYLNHLAIDKRYRGFGGGKILLEKVEKLAVIKDCQKIVVKIFTNCYAAQALFLKSGYTIEGFIDCIKEKHNLIVMVKKVIL
ncbi:MAG: phosphopantothenate/pantothenate synthetase [Symploca sp. SIO1C4]|uniref:Phosphopantothenate/pantothenate synthetase n=1 Tax=Symploca sp. SIO1C4 TaxID=2607765 RepID=A0A6B3N0Z6_9CYAN|nr:phosphopantothenate/pantothenate synthetase [Symploca sp. SIO1C4]